MTRPGASRTMRFRLSATTASQAVVPSRSALVESPSISATPASPTDAEPVQLGAAAVDRRVVDLDVAGVDDGALGGVQHDGDGVRDGVRDADELGPERPHLDDALGAARSRAARTPRIRPCSSSFDLIMPSVRRVAHTSGTPTSRIRYGRPPTWSSWPCVRITARMRSGVLAQVGEVGQHEVDAEHLVAREGDAGVDDDDALGRLDHRHVLADLADPAERDHPDDAGSGHTAASRPAALERRAHHGALGLGGRAPAAAAARRPRSRAARPRP